MQIEFQAGSYYEIECDLLAFPVFEGETADATLLRSLNKRSRGIIAAVLSSGEFKPELHRTCLIHRPTGLKAKRLLLVGAGKRDEFKLAALRQLAGTAARSARAAGCKTAALVRRSDHALQEAACAVAEGVLYGLYDSDIYRTSDREDRHVEKFILAGREASGRSEAESGIRRGVVIGEATNFARTLVNEPSNVLTPAKLSERALEAGSKAGLEIQILERAEIEKLGMNTLLAVARGSDQPPKFIVMRIRGQERRARPHALIGKGVTFDSGGISLKPAERMEEMKGDMAGGAAVLGAMMALARIKPAANLIGLIPVVENLPSGKATKPGDIVRSMSGKTIEIINTDAEGRLILADALVYARKLGASHLIDIATLTGACMIALGMVHAGMMGTDEKTIERLAKQSDITGERLWRLPLDPEYRKLIRSEIADVKNVGNKWGGAITAAKFLQEFVADTPWVHLDIAGMDLDSEGRPYSSKGATGFGVRTLVQLFL